MGTLYPLAIVSSPASTSLVRTTPHHHVYHTKTETSEGVTALDGSARNAAAENPFAQLVGDIPVGRNAKNQMATEPERDALL